jgi:quercetin dioxygenase-like cupin family protein
MLGKSTTERYTEIIPGIRIKTLVHGANTLMTQFMLAKGSTLTAHNHPYEQTGYLVAGHIRLTIGSKTFDVREHDSWCIESGVEHTAQVLEDSIAIEIFNPAREDYLKYFSEQDTARE